jgi:hypothetical protein
MILELTVEDVQVFYSKQLPPDDPRKKIAIEKINRLDSRVVGEMHRLQAATMSSVHAQLVTFALPL